jgi:hypothetical protein
LTVVVGVVSLTVCGGIFDIERLDTTCRVHQRFIDDSPKVVGWVGVGDAVGVSCFNGQRWIAPDTLKKSKIKENSSWLLRKLG